VENDTLLGIFNRPHSHTIFNIDMATACTVNVLEDLVKPTTLMSIPGATLSLSLPQFKAIGELILVLYPFRDNLPRAIYGSGWRVEKGNSTGGPCSPDVYSKKCFSIQWHHRYIQREMTLSADGVNC